MKHQMQYILISAILLLCVSCGEGKVFVNILTGKDTNIPVLTSVYMKNDRQAVLVFDEKVTPFGNTFKNYQVSTENCTITVTLPDKLAAGDNMTLSARVQDEAGNTTGFSVILWGYNPNPAGILINELTLASSTKQCRRTELYVKSSGSVSGLCLYAGSPSLNDCSFIFPDIFMNAGSFIVVWWTDYDTFKSFFPNAQKLSSCLVSKDDNCCNMCPEKGDIKFSSSNGVQSLTISPSPGARIVDAVVWSAGKAEKYEGFGTSAVYDRVCEVVTLGGWLPSEVSSKNASDTSEMNNASTRSLYRTSLSDTDTSADWAVSKSGQFSIGFPNN